MKTTLCLQLVMVAVVFAATSPTEPEETRSVAVVREKRAPVILGTAALGLAAVGGLGLAGAAVGKAALVGGAVGLGALGLGAGLGAAKFYGGHYGPRYVHHHYPSVRYGGHYGGGHGHYGYGYGYGYGW